MVKYVNIDAKISDIKEDIKKGENFVVMDKKGKIIGVISNEKIIKYIFSEDIKIDKLVLKMKPIEDFDLLKIAEKFISSNSRIILVKRNDNVEALTLFDFLKILLENEKKIFEISVDEIQHPVETIYEMDSLDRAIGIMKFKGISRLVVVDKNGIAVGMISISDILRKYLDINKEKTLYDKDTKVKVRSVMSEKLIFINKGELLSKAIELIIKNGIFALPVLDNNNPVGIITAKDILVYYVAKKREKLYENIIVHGINLDEIDYSFIKKTIGDVLNKYRNLIGDDAYVDIHIKKVNEERKTFGKNIYFKIRARIVSSKVKIHAETDVTYLYTGIRKIRKIFEEELEKIKEGKIKYRDIMRLLKDFEYL